MDVFKKIISSFLITIYKLLIFKSERKIKKLKYKTVIEEKYYENLLKDAQKFCKGIW